MHIPDSLVGPLYTAIIGGAFTFVGAVLTKEQKTSEFRQVWIDALRADLAEYVSKTEELGRYIHKAQHDPEVKYGQFASDRRVKGEALRALEARILLRLNPKEHLEFIERIKGLADDILLGLAMEEQITPAHTDIPGAFPFAEQRIQNLVSVSHEVLKKEWCRVKRGEPIYRMTKWGSIILVICLLIISAINALHEPQPAVATDCISVIAPSAR